MTKALSPHLLAMSAAGILSLVWDLGYHVLSLESAVCLLLALAVGIGLSLVSMRSQRLRMGLLVFLFVCLVDIFFLRLAWLAWTVLVLGVALAMSWPRRVPATVLVVAAMAFALILRGQAPASQARPVLLANILSGPTELVVHLMLDELGGLDSIPQAYRRQQDVDAITRAYAQRGFQLRGGVESLSPDSPKSLGMMLDNTALEEPDRTIRKLEGKDAYQIVNNRLQAAVAKKGWNVTIVQSWFLDYCRPEFSCVTYSLEGSSRIFEALGDRWQRLQVLERELYAALISERHGLVLVDLVRPAIFEYLVLRSNWRNPTLPLVAMQQFDLLQQGLLEARGRQYVFAHILLPHFPWVYDQDCKVKPFAAWRLPYAARYRPEADARAEAFAAYQDQAMCAHHKVLALVDALDQAYPGQVQFIIHGDHGPRILLREIPEAGVDSLDADTRRNLLSAFVAARLAQDPGVLLPADASLQTVIPTLVQRAIGGVDPAAGPAQAE